MRRAGLVLLAGLGMSCVVVMAFLVGCGAMPQEAPQATRQAGESSATREDGSFHWAPVSGSPAIKTGYSALDATLLRPGEELWVVVRPESSAPGDDVPGCGSMMVKLPDAEEEVPVPLKHTDVKTRISAYVASVDVTQTFSNPYGSKIEAAYVFPLPTNAAVHDFLMTVGTRRIRGIIREREEAEKIYYEARKQGHVASLLTQERPNIFTQRVANIEPAKEIEVNIRYFHTLACVDGWYEYTFPMVVGPRFNPPGSTEGVGAVGARARGRSGQKTEVGYLRPRQRSGHDISLFVDLDAGVPIEAVACPSHVVGVTRPDGRHAAVKLSENDAIPNRDFILRYKVAGEGIKSVFLAHTDPTGGYFTLMLQPPDASAQLVRDPVEMVFVIDCSGSMQGKPLNLAKDAVTRALRRLDRDDTFQVISFSESSSTLGPAPLPATRENIARGVRYVESLKPGGGTMMINGIRAALDFPHNPERLRLVSFMTDGYIGNETEILGEIGKRLGETRIFSFGVGESPNRYLLENMALMGRGAVADVNLDEGAVKTVDLYYERIRHPALTDIQIDWGGMKVEDVYPRQVPDLFVGRPVVLTGRFKAPEGNATVRVGGKSSRRTVQFDVPVVADGQHPGLDKVWARMKIADLSNQALLRSGGSPEREIRKVALQHNLVSAFTAFVAVDALSRTAGDSGTTVNVPVPVPEGVRYDTTVHD